MAYLVIVRHGQSEWNALGLWTGWQDPPLSPQGEREATLAGEHLRELPLHKAYTSRLSRAQQTLERLKLAAGHPDLETIAHEALNERDYGDFTGKNKWEVQATLGDEEFQKLRRHWDHPVPNGETMKAVHARVVPYYEAHILTDLKAGKNVVVAAHGNSMRALMKHLDQVPDQEIHQVTLDTDEIIIYEITPTGAVAGKQVRRTSAPDQPPA